MEYTTREIVGADFCGFIFQNFEENDFKEPSENALRFVTNINS